MSSSCISLLMTCLIIVLSGCNQQQKPPFQIVELATELGVLWEANDIASIDDRVFTIAPPDGNRISVLYLKMVVALICDRNVKRYEEYKCVFEQAVKSRDDHDQIVELLSKFPNLDHIIDIVIDDDGYERMAALWRTKMPGRLPYAEFAIWLDGGKD